MKKILVLGSATVDVTLKIDRLPNLEDDVSLKSQKLSLGGCAFNVAWMLKLLDVPCKLAVPVGQGIYGDFVRTELIKKGFEIWKESEEDNGSCTCLVTEDGNRTFLAMHGGEYHYRKNWLEELDSAEYSLVYVCGIDLEEKVNDCVIDFLEKVKLPVCFAPGPRISYLPMDRLERMIKLASIIHLNKKEAKIILDRFNSTAYDLLDGLYELCGGTIVITDGANGSMAFDGKEKLYEEAVKVKQYDSTGAGDGHAGTIMACIYKGYSLRESLNMANKISAEIVQVEGPVIDKLN